MEEMEQPLPTENASPGRAGQPNRERRTLVERCLHHKTALLAIWGGAILLSFVAIAWHVRGNHPLIDNSVGIWFMKDDPELVTYDRLQPEFGPKEWTSCSCIPKSVSRSAFLRDDLAGNHRPRSSTSSTSPKSSLSTNVRDSAQRRRRAGRATHRFIPDAMRRRSSLQPDRSTHSRHGFVRTRFSTTALPDRPTQHGRPAVQERQPHTRGRLRIGFAWSTPSSDVVDQYPTRHPAIRWRDRRWSMPSSIGRRSTMSFVFYVLVSLFIGAGGYVSLRNIKDLAVLLIVVTASAITPMGAIALLKIPYNMVTVMLPPFLITFSVCDVVHVINDFHFERTIRPGPEAVVAAVRKIWTPCLCTSAITIVGLLSLVASTVHPIRELGAFAALGLFVAWLVTMTLVPVLLTMMSYGRARAAGERSAAAQGFGTYAQHLAPVLTGKYRFVWLGVAAVMLYTLAGLSRVEVDTDYTKFFGHDTAVTRSYADIKQAGFGQNPVAIVLRYPEGSTYATGDHFKRLMDFERAVARNPRHRQAAVADANRRSHRHGVQRTSRRRQHLGIFRGAARPAPAAGRAVAATTT